MKKTILSLMLILSMLFFSGCGFVGDIIRDLSGDSMTEEDVFINAVRYNNFELVEEMIENCNIDESAMNKCLYNSVYGYNIFDNYYEMEVYLLEHGADPNYKDMFSRAYFYEKIQHLAALLSSDDLNINEKSGLGHSALYTMVDNTFGYRSYKISKMLLDNGAQVDDLCFVNDRYNQYDRYSKYGEYTNIVSSPPIVQLYMTEYLNSGKELDIPQAVQSAILGEITECLEIVKDNSEELTTKDKSIIMAYASYYGTLNQYLELKDIFSLDNYGTCSGIAACGNIEMIEYVMEVNDWDYECDEELYESDYDYSQDYNMSIMPMLEYAVAFNQVELSNFLMEKKVKPDIAVLVVAISCSQNIDLVKSVYYYINDNFEQITEEDIGYIISCACKLNGYTEELSEYDKQVYDFFFEKGYTLRDVNFNDMSDEKIEYLVNNGCEITPKNLCVLVRRENADNLQAAYDQGLVPTLDDFKSALKCGYSDSVQLMIDNGFELPDDILTYTTMASKATVEVLIDAGANTKLTFDKLMPADGGGVVREGDFDLKDYYKHYGRDDLADLL